MYMIGFTAEFQKCASPAFPYFRKGFTKSSSGFVVNVLRRSLVTNTICGLSEYTA
jgi:hypothetical protein